MDLKFNLVEVKAYSKKEAIELAKEQGFTLDIKYDATTAYNNAVIEADFDLQTFADSQITKKTRNTAGAGIIVAVDPGKEETKTRLYKVENIPTEGIRHYTLSYELVTESGFILGSAPLKDEAIDMAKPLVNEVKQKINIRLVKTPDTQALAATVHYEPSPDTKLGTYILFGLSL